MYNTVTSIMAGENQSCIGLRYTPWLIFLGQMVSDGIYIMFNWSNRHILANFF